VPQTLLLNKADKLGRQAIAQAVRAARESVGARGGDPASVHAFSAVGKEGVPHLRAMVDDWLIRALTEGPGQGD
jgi:GTP-binding protein EngB required for normal cell division